MREQTNLGWPEVPFGAGQRPFPRTVHLLAATSVQWADDGERAVPVAVGAVYLPVKRTSAVTLAGDTLHFGYRVMVAEREAEFMDLVAFLDGHLVQARRHAAILAAHSWEDDASGLRAWSPGTRGITAVTDAWNRRARAERGLARLVDTASDTQLIEADLLRCASYHRLLLSPGTGGILLPEQIQDAYESLIVQRDGPLTSEERDLVTCELGVSALTAALTIALVAGVAIERFTWPRPLSPSGIIGQVAWDAFPRVLHCSDLRTTTQ